MHSPLVLPAPASDRVAVLDPVAALAAKQHGMVCRSQFREAGGTDSQLRSWQTQGRLLRVVPGVFRMAGAPPSWEGDLVAHTLASGGFGSHRCAGHVLDVAGFSRPPALEITVPRGRNYRHDGVRVHQSVDVALAGIQVVRGVRVSSPERFLLDMGKVWSIDHVELCADDLLRRGLITWESARDVYLLHAKQGRNGCGVLRALIEQRYGEDDQADSGGERLFFRVIDRSDLPRSVMHHRIVAPNGKFVMETDAAWPEAMVCSMFDGKKFHLNAEAFERDSAKRRWATALGWAVVPCTYRTVTVEPWVLLRQLDQLLTARLRRPAS